MKRKWNSDRGETLVEVLASILIASLSVALLFGSIMASSTIDRGAQNSDAAYYEALSNAEKQTGDTSEVMVTVSRKDSVGSTSIDAKRYGGEGVFSYAKGDASEGGSS